MPPRARAVTFALCAWAAAACSPSRFGWRDDHAEVSAYREAFAVAAGDTFVAAATRPELFAAASTARVLWLGDHHRSTRLHTLQQRLLQELRRSGRPLALALEAIGEQDEAWLRAFVTGGIDEPLLRARIRQRWPHSWLDDDGLDAAFYRELLGFARTHRLPVAALEPTPRLPLAERDERIAANVRAFAAAHPDRLVVVVGQAHLAGRGDLVRRCGLPSLALGGEPTAALRDAAPPPGAVRTPPARDTWWCSSGGLWWFAELCGDAPRP